MIKHVMRSAAVAVGAVLTVSALATPAAAEDTVPEGCVGSVYYACTGDAKPDFYAEMLVESPATVNTPALTILPSATAGGEPIGGVIPIGGQTVPGASLEVGGPVEPIDTGLVLPTQVCLLVTCLPAGTPIVVPGIDLPIVPVVIPPTTVPAEDLDLPVLGYFPVVTTPAIVLPAIKSGPVRVWLYRGDLFTAAVTFCEMGGGWLRYGDEGRVQCEDSSYSLVANLLFSLYYAG